MADTLDQFAYAPGDMCIGICWKGGGTPAKESKHRDWEVRVLVARVEGDQIVWRAGEKNGAGFWGDFSDLGHAKERAKVAAERCRLQYLVHADLGRPVWTKEAEVIEWLKEL